MEAASQSLATGQVAERLVWAALTAQSGGRLHVFLPLLDRGLDAVVHRLDDGSYLGLQVKIRTSERWHEVHVVVPAEELYDDSALLIAGLLAEGALGPLLLVVPVGVFRERARGLRRFLAGASGPGGYVASVGTSGTSPRGSIPDRRPRP